MVGFLIPNLYTSSEDYIDAQTQSVLEAFFSCYNFRIPIQNCTRVRILKLISLDQLNVRMDRLGEGCSGVLYSGEAESEM